MNDKDLERKIKEEMDREIEERGYAAPADLLMALGYLDKGGYREWKDGYRILRKHSALDRRRYCVFLLS